MANPLHDKVFNFLEEYRSSHPDFLYWLRERNTGNRLMDGYWFQGNLDYAYVGLYDRSGGSNKTRSIGIYFTQSGQNIKTVFEVVFNEEEDKRLLKLYAEIMKRLGGFNRLSDTRFQKTLSTTDGLAAASKFLTKERPVVDEAIRELNLEEIFIEKYDFDSKLKHILSIKDNPASSLFPPSKIEELKRKYAAFKNDEFFKERVRQLRFIPFAQRVVSNFLKNDLVNETLTGLIQVLKNGAKSETVNYHIDKNIADINLRSELKKEFSEFGFTGYTGAGKTGIYGLDYGQLETVKKFILDCFVIKTKEEAAKRVEEFDALEIPQVKCGVYSPWLYYINPWVFPIKNNSHNGFIKWCNQPTDSYSLAILLFHEVAEILGEKDLGLIDAFTHMFSDGDETRGEEFVSNNKEINTMTLNTILYGPPGTGKTYHTINKAVSIANPLFNMAAASREQLKAEYERLVRDGQVEFITFHQSMSYEDFIEGIKPMEPKEEDEFLKYEIKDGIFKRLCERAGKVPETKPAGFSISEEEFQKAGFYKMSLGDTSNPDDDQIYDWCIKNGYIALGRGDANDFTGMSEGDIQQMVPAKLDKFSAQSVNAFVHYVKVGDYVVVTYGNLLFRAIGKVTGSYEYKNVEGLNVHQFRKVNWLVKNIELPYEELYERQFQQQSIYRLDKKAIRKEFLLGNINNSPSFDELYAKFLIKVTDDLSKSVSQPLFFESKRSKVRVLAVDAGTIRTIGESANTEETIQKDKLKLIYDAYKTPDDINSPAELRILSTAISWTTNYFAAFKALKDFEATFKGRSTVIKSEREQKNYILIIDEINRGNVSQIFGELITLIEEDKRAGKEEALTVTLPYSKKPFTVPSNLYIIGTMNTADRSVEALDTALRRRFEFEEMKPEPGLLNSYSLLQKLWSVHWDVRLDENYNKWKEAEKEFIGLTGMVKKQKEYSELDYGYDYDELPAFLISDPKELFKDIVSFSAGVEIDRLLETLNIRLTALLSKDHTIGHAWLMNVFSLKDLQMVFRNKIIPLLQEFFYNDYAKIGLVLGNAFVSSETVKSNLFATFKDDTDLAGEYTDKVIYKLNDPMGIDVDGFKSIYTGAK